MQNKNSKSLDASQLPKNAQREFDATEDQRNSAMNQTQTTVSLAKHYDDAEEQKPHEHDDEDDEKTTLLGKEKQQRKSLKGKKSTAPGSRCSSTDTKSSIFNIEDPDKARKSHDLKESTPKIVNEEERWKLLTCALVSLFVSHSATLNITAVLPTYCKQFHPTLSELQISYPIIGLHITSLLVSPLAGVIISRMGRKNSIVAGFILILISVMGQGGTALIKNDMAYLVSFVLLRLIQGVGDMWTWTTYYSLIAQKFPENREKYLGLGEAMAGIGGISGPIFASFVYTRYGYFLSFVFFMILILIAISLSVFYLPDSMNFSIEGPPQEPEFEQNNENYGPDHQEQPQPRLSLRSILAAPKLTQQPPTYAELFGNRRTFFIFLTCTLESLTIIYNASFFTTVLLEDKGIPEKYHFIIVSLMAFSYFAVSFFIGNILMDEDYHNPNPIKKRVVLTLAMIGGSLSLFMMGPSFVLGLPNSNLILFVGQVLRGVASAFVFIPTLPEIIDSIYAFKGYKVGNDERLDGIVSDKASAMYNLFFCLGMIVSPLIGSLIFEHFKSIKDHFAYNKTTDVVAIMVLSYAAIHYFSNVLPDQRKSRQFQKQQEHIKNLAHKDDEIEGLIYDPIRKEASKLA